MLSDQGSKPKKSQIFLNMKKDQSIRKSTIEPMSLKTNTSQSKLPNNIINVPTFRPTQEKQK